MRLEDVCVGLCEKCGFFELQVAKGMVCEMVAGSVYCER